MDVPPNDHPLFRFEEQDHPTRIQLKLALEDVGFSVSESEEALTIIGARPLATPGDLSPALNRLARSSRTR